MSQWAELIRQTDTQPFSRFKRVMAFIHLGQNFEARPLNISMYKFLITIKLHPGTRDRILEAAPEAQKKTREEAGCLSYDFFTCTDDPDQLVFIECFTSKEAHELHCDQEYTKKFIAFHEQFHESLTFETINIAQ